MTKSPNTIRLALLICAATMTRADAAPLETCTQITVGLMGEFKRPTARTTQPFGAEIRKGVEIGLGILKTKKSHICLAIEQVDISNSIANIPDLIRKSAREKNIHIFLGLGTSDQALAAEQPLKATKSVLFTPTASSEQLIGTNRRIVLLFPRNKQIARFLAAEARHRGIKKIAIIWGNNSLYSQDMARLFQEDFESMGGTVSLTIPIRIGSFSMTEHIESLKRTDYSHIFLPLYELDVAKVASQLAEAGIHKDFIGSDSWGTFSKVIRTFASDLNFQALLPVVYSPLMPTSQNASFVAAYRHRYGGAPSDLAAFSYDGIRLIAKALNGCPELTESPADLETCLDKALPFDSVTGPITSREQLALKRSLSAINWSE